MMYKFTKSESLEAVKNEVARAREKHPSNEHLLAALAEEVGELNKAFIEKDFEHAKLEAIQTACVALRILEEGDKDYESEYGNWIKEENFDIFNAIITVLSYQGVRYNSIKINKRDNQYVIYFVWSDHPYLHTLLKTGSDKETFEKFKRILPEILKNKSSLETIC
jgi:hypothetical protein